VFKKRLVLTFIFTLLAQYSVYAADMETPKAVIELATESLLKLAQKEKAAIAIDPEPYFTEVKSQLMSSVDFAFIAKQVMGKKHWPKANDEQKADFSAAFTNSLVRTYGKGIASFSDSKTSIAEPKLSADGSKAWVIMTVKRQPKNAKVAYLMHKTDTGWKAINVVLDGTKLMEAFRSQFDGAIERHGTIQQVVDTWESES
jgi:phospholipid transport system substrate-binding protein